MVGHMDEKMTAHYADHETVEDLNNEMKKLSSPFLLTGESNQTSVRRQLAELAYSLPEDIVRQLVESATSLTEPETSLRQLWSV
jgi:hypothetical protein